MQLSYYMNSLKPSMLSGCDLHCLDKIWPLRLTLYTIRANIFRTRKIFPVSNADALTGFLALWCSRPQKQNYRSVLGFCAIKPVLLHRTVLFNKFEKGILCNKTLLHRMVLCNKAMPFLLMASLMCVA